ncbi:MAG: hypothetical protein J1F05_00380 [Muribaculaceae bacterium]|nr:hypothetical protein [Muribaculaceae bacterium]
MKTRLLFFALATMATAYTADACTSMIVSADATVDGRPILWKHRDTSASNNFLYRVENPGEIGYVALFNGSDKLCLDEAWMGMNDEGFAIMNTASYNLPPNAHDWIDREGIVMAKALATCRTVDDFETLLIALPKPLGVCANFGVIDANGDGAYFEADDYNYTRFNLSDSPNGVLIRTNYSYSGVPDKGMGYIRHKNTEVLLATQIEKKCLTPASLTEGVSRSFYNSLLDVDAAAGSEHWAVDQDFVPRRISTASIAIEGLKKGESPENMIMWANVAYPPCSHVEAVTLNHIPGDLLPLDEDCAYSNAGLQADKLKAQVFPITRGSGKNYVNLDAVRAISEEQYQISLEEYAKGQQLRKK